MRARGTQRLRAPSIPFQPARTPVFMRVRESLPPFTLRLSENFVNGKRPVSTGFLRFLPVFPENVHRLELSKVTTMDEMY
jgi:hypothetical protein